MTGDENRKDANGIYASALISLSFLATMMLCLGFHSGKSSADEPVKHEPEWAKEIAVELGGETEVRLPDQSRVDILTDTTAWEVEWSDKWPESIGQALFYANSTGKTPGVILLLRGDKAEEDYLECLSVVARLRCCGRFEFRTLKTD